VQESTRKPDPAIAAWERLQAAEKAHSAAYDARDEAEMNACACGSYASYTPIVWVGNYECCTVGAVRRHTKGLSSQVVQPLIDALHQQERAMREQRRKAGLASFDAV
jgi:hypothetical protein